MEFKILVAFVLLMPLSLVFIPNDLLADVVVVDWITYDKPDHRDACEFVQDKEHGLAYDHCFFDESATEEGRYVAYSTTPETREKRENFRILGGGDDTKVTIPNQEIPLEETTDIETIAKNTRVQVRYATEGLYVQKLQILQHHHTSRRHLFSNQCPSTVRKLPVPIL